MNMNDFLHSKERGSAMPLALVAVMILLAVGVGLLSLGYNGRIFSIRTASDVAARCAADSGVEIALFEMNKKLQVKPYAEGTLPEVINVKLPYSDQVCSYNVTGNLFSGYVITSLGQAGRAQRAVRATIGFKGVFDHAILTKGNLWLKSGTVVDGYNSDDLSDKDVEVSIGSMSTANDSVVLNNGVVINGDVSAAGGDMDMVIKDLGAKITGGKYISAPIDTPEVILPALFDKGTDISAKGETVTIGPADNGTYTGIKLESTGVPGVIEVDGEDVVLHVTGDIQLGNSCEIVVKDGSSLTIYTDGNITCALGSGINSEAPPEKSTAFQLYATGEGTQDFDIKAKSTFTGVIYAPNANVDLYANGNAYGAIVAGSFDFKNGGNFFYDEALKKKNDPDKDVVQFAVTSWDESPPMLASDIKLADVMSILEADPVK